jgi:DNA uptake protein ComE-like DNA-binding protein
MSWKDYFYFTKSQRVGLSLLIAAIVAITIADAILHHNSSPTITTVQDTAFINKATRFKVSLKENHTNKYSYPSENSKQQATPQLFTFNPNLLDSASFVKLGLSPFITHNILKYRSKGGRFKKKADFAKIYTLSSKQFTTLEPYIDIPTDNKNSSEIRAKSIDLNSADSTQLKQIKGMPGWLAKRIITYRKKLGGYASANQLAEVWDMPPELFQKIKPLFTIDISKINKIQVNDATIDALKKLPYTNYYQAKEIYEYRKKKGKIKSIEELKSIDEELITTTYLEKIKPYLTF